MYRWLYIVCDRIVSWCAWTINVYYVYINFVHCAGLIWSLPEIDEMHCLQQLVWLQDCYAVVCLSRADVNHVIFVHIDNVYVYLWLDGLSSYTQQCYVSPCVLSRITIENRNMLTQIDLFTLLTDALPKQTNKVHIHILWMISFTAICLFQVLCLCSPMLIKIISLLLWCLAAA